MKIKPHPKDNKILLKSISTNETHQVQYTEGQVVSNPTDVTITPDMFKDNRVAPTVDVISDRG